MTCVGACGSLKKRTFYLPCKLNALYSKSANTDSLKLLFDILVGLYSVIVVFSGNPYYIISAYASRLSVNPYLAIRDNSRAVGVCQLKSLSYLQYTTCNHSEQVFSYRSEPTFIQTRHSSLDSQVLDFTHTKKDREYQISSCH